MSTSPKQSDQINVLEIDIQQAQLLLEAGTATFVDVRDPSSFHAGHHSSVGATAYFQDQGFTAVSSLSGGFTAWHEAGGSSEQGARHPPSTSSG